MSAIKILTRRTSHLERAITFEVDGRTLEVAAPAAGSTFEELEARIEREYANTGTVDDNKSEDAPENKPQTKRGRKSSKGNEEQVE